MSTEMHPLSRPSASGSRRTRLYVSVLVAAPLLALASTQAEAEGGVPEGVLARAGAGFAGSGTAGSGWDGLGGSGGSGIAGSTGRGGASPLDSTPSASLAPLLTVPFTVPSHLALAPGVMPPAPPSSQTTLRRSVQLENGSEQALGDPAGSPTVSALTADLMVTANGSCGHPVDQVGVARNPRDRAP